MRTSVPFSVNLRTTFTRNPARLFGNGRLQDVLLAGLSVAVISLMVLPLPAVLLDGLIAINIGVSVLLLMMAMYARSPLALSTFPTLLLFTTLFRLSLNIASTRSILLHADAGKIIETFGKLVVGGNVVVGIVVFLIIAIVQFIVIAKGAERIAEVGARFTLDALPGRQMSIEAELRAGLIDRDESQTRRDLLQRESQLYGAMDGAMKFVKGDAIAGLLIALVNILAGVSIGLIMNQMPLIEAINTYTVLTVGDGLVSQIPSLFVSLAAGVLITRVCATPKDNEPEQAGGRGVNLANEIGSQFAAQPQALLVTAFVLFLFIWIPGFPKIQFLFWSALLGCTGFLATRLISRRTRKDPMAQSRLRGDWPRHRSSSHDGDRALLTIEPLTLSVSTAHKPQVESGLMLEAVNTAREQMSRKFGLPFPGISFRIDNTLSADAFSLHFNDVPVSQGCGDCEQIEVSLTTTMHKYAADFLGLQETRDLLNDAQRHFPDLIAETLKLVPVPRLMQVLKALIREDIPIRNLRDILQALIEWSPREKDPLALAEHARSALAAQLTWQYGGSERTLYSLTLSENTEETIRSAIRASPEGGYLALDPKEQLRLGALAARLAAQAPLPEGALVCVLASMDIRRHVKRMLAVNAPELGVISYQDLSAEARVVSVGVLT